MSTFSLMIIINREAREIMYLVASVCPSVGQQRAKKSHYQSKVFVCVSSNHADAFDRLLIPVIRWEKENC